MCSKSLLPHLDVLTLFGDPRHSPYTQMHSDLVLQTIEVVDGSISGPAKFLIHVLKLRVLVELGVLATHAVLFIKSKIRRILEDTLSVVSKMRQYPIVVFDIIRRANGPVAC